VPSNANGQISSVCSAKSCECSVVLSLIVTEYNYQSYLHVSKS